MHISYKNRKGNVHYVRCNKTKNGANRYFIVKHKPNLSKKDLIKEIPEGFSFYEFPEDARVTFRKTKQTTITNEEKTIVLNNLKHQSDIEDFIVETELNLIKIFIGHLKRDEFEYDDSLFKDAQSYIEKLQIKKDKNTYQVRRFCSLSDNYGWITLETGNNLTTLCDKYFHHITKESLLNFWIEGEEDY